MPDEPEARSGHVNGAANMSYDDTARDETAAMNVTPASGHVSVLRQVSKDKAEGRYVRSRNNIQDDETTVSDRFSALNIPERFYSLINISRGLTSDANHGGCSVGRDEGGSSRGCTNPAFRTGDGGQPARGSRGGFHTTTLLRDSGGLTRNPLPAPRCSAHKGTGKRLSGNDQPSIYKDGTRHTWFEQGGVQTLTSVRSLQSESYGRTRQPVVKLKLG